MAADFYREVAAFVDDGTGDLIREVLAEAGRAEFAVAGRARGGGRAAVASPGGWPCGRAGWWARRSARPSTCWPTATRSTVLLVEGTGDLTGVAGLITRITDRHAERMAALGLDS